MFLLPTSLRFVEEADDAAILFIVQAEIVSSKPSIKPSPSRVPPVHQERGTMTTKKTRQ